MSEIRTLPRLGFLGVGCIGRHRLEAVYQAGAAEIGAIADPDRDAAVAAAESVRGARVAGDLDELLEHELDGVVIATPTALHAPHARVVLERGLPVFCQKPLARTAPECRELVELARRADVALGVDMPYRYTAAVGAALEALRAGRIGLPHAAELTFHNARGPDKAWARSVDLAGGGALIDLGCHLIDLARSFMGRMTVRSLHVDLFSAGRPLGPDPREVEDLALAQLTLVDWRSVRLACSWWLPANTDAVIEAAFYGDRGALIVRNVNGSLDDFEALVVDGGRTEQLATPPDDWRGRALIAWAARIARDPGFDDEVEQLVTVAEVLDMIYGRRP
jgi:predicted dehydrogenase